jgi:hypothetical protein
MGIRRRVRTLSGMKLYKPVVMDDGKRGKGKHPPRHVFLHEVSPEDGSLIPTKFPRYKHGMLVINRKRQRKQRQWLRNLKFEPPVRGQSRGRKQHDGSRRKRATWPSDSWIQPRYRYDGTIR